MMNNMYDILAKLNSVGKQNLTEGKRPDFLDLDKDGDKKEPMAQAARQAKEVDEASYSAKAASAGKDIGKPGKNFEKIAKSAGERYGSKAAGERVAGAVLAKLRAKEDVNEASLRQIFNRNENDNNHAENAVLLAKHFGTPEEHQQAKDALAYRDSHGGYSSSDREGKKHIQTVGNLHKKYGHKIVAEADMEEGNDFTGARLAAIRAGKPTFKVDGKTYRVTGDTSDEKVMEKTVWPGTKEYKAKYPDDMRTGEKRRSSTGGEIERTATGVKHTAKAYDDEEETATADDGAPKKKGRPKGSKRALGAKGPTGKSKLLNKGSLRETDLEEDYDQDEYDEEGEMAKSQSRTIADAAEELQHMLGDNENLPEWVQKKITLAQEYIDSARDYLAANRPEEETMMAEASGNTAKMARVAKMCARDATFAGDRKDFLKAAKFFAAGDEARGLDTIRDMDTDARDDFYMGCEKAGIPVPMDEETMMAEKAVSKAQRAAAGIARAAQKGEIPKSELRGASKEMAKMPAGELKKFAKTKEKGLPEKVKEEDKDKKEVEETTVAGSVAPAAEAPKGKKGMIFGKGVYEGQIAESFEKKLTKVLTEGISINASQGEDGKKTLTVNATDDDAVKLAQILQLAGMQQGQGYNNACPSCGGMHEGECLEETDLANSPDEQTMDTDMMINTMSGGLNGRKTTGQTTGAPFNAQPARQGALHGRMEEVVESNAGRLWKLYQRYETRK